MVDLAFPAGRPVIDYTARDYDSILAAMREQIPTLLPEWTEFAHEADFGKVLLELFAHMGDILSYYQDRVAGESFLATAQTRRSVIAHLQLIGYRMATAVPAETRLRITVAQAATGIVTIRRGAAFGTASLPDRPSVRFEYNGAADLTVELDGLAADPTDPTRKLLAAALPVEQGRLVRDELVGTSTGAADQRFELLQPRVILRSPGGGADAAPDLVVRSVLGNDEQRWRVQRSLAFSRSEPDVELAVDEDDRVTVRFGDGVLTGAVPAAGSEIRISYRVGGGALGNVPAGAVTTVVDAPELAGARVTNPAAAGGGADRESIEHAVRNAPAVFRAQERAVTAGDYRALALQVNGVGKVRADADRRNVVTLYVAPAGGGQVNDALAATLLAFFAERRAVTTVVEIADVDYVPVSVTALVGVDSFYSRSGVEQAVRAAAGGLLDFDSVDFGQQLFLSKFYEAIEAVPGVAFTTVTEFRLPSGPPDTVEPTGRLKLDRNEVPVPGHPGGIRLIMEGGF